MRKFIVNNKGFIELTLDPERKKDQYSRMQDLKKLFELFSKYLNVRYICILSGSSPISEFFSVHDFRNSLQLMKGVYDYINNHAIECKGTKKLIGDEFHNSYAYSEYILKIDEFFKLIDNYVKLREKYEPKYNARNWIITETTFELLDNNNGTMLAFHNYDSGPFIISNRLDDMSNPVTPDSDFVNKILPILKEWEKEIEQEEKNARK